MTQNLAFDRKRKLLLFLPLLVLPFAALAFHVLGDRAGDDEKSPSGFLRGLSTELPAAYFDKESPKTKWDYYQQAQKEAAAESIDTSTADGLPIGMLPSGPSTGGHQQADLIHEKIAQIEAAIQLPEAEAEPVTPAAGLPADSVNSLSADIDRLERLMTMIQSPAQKDPELEQIDALVEKLLALQQNEVNPEIEAPEAPLQTADPFRAIPAIIVRKQKAVQGATIELKLQDSVTLNGQLIPEGHSVFGTCRITNQRLLLDIESIRLGTSIIPVDLTVYSLDGMPGINAPEAQLAEAAAGGARNAMRGIDLIGYDPGIASQVAGAGIDAAKDLLSRKLKRIKVKLEKGQRVLLRNNLLEDS